MSRHTHVAWARRALRATSAGLRRLPAWPTTRVRRAVLGDAPGTPDRRFFRDLTAPQKLRILRWLQVEVVIRDGFDSEFARLLEAARQTLMLDAPPGYDPDEEVTRERLGEDQ